MSRDILKQLSDADVIALRVDGDEWPRSLLSSTAIPESWMGLVLKRDGTRRFVPAGEDPKPSAGDQLVLVRRRPIGISLAVADQPASCGADVNGTCEIRVRWDARDDDLAALSRALLGSAVLTVDRLTDALAEAGARTALRRFISATPAARLVREDLRSPLLDQLQVALKRFLFDAGIVLDRVARLEFHSEALARKEVLERQAAEHLERIKARDKIEQAALAVTRRRLNDLGGILDKLKAATVGDENARWHELLPALSPAERGRLLENLWRITPDRNAAAALVVVSGDECLWLNPIDPERITRRVTLGGDLGGLRSVAFATGLNWLLIGAARGVWTLDADSGEVAGRFVVPDVEPPRTGFNAATTLGDRLYATSSQLGCWSWLLDDPEIAKPVLVPEDGVPKRIRAAIATDDGRLLFTADDCIHVFDPRSEELSVLSSAADTIQCMTALEGTLFVGTTGGKLFRVEMAHPDDWWLVQQLTAGVESVQARRWSDLVELIVPAGPRGVSGIYADQHVVTCLLESPTAIRRAWACDDVVMALNHLRDRLVVMNANLPERTGREVRISRITSQSIQDACIVLRCETDTADTAVPPPDDEGKAS